MKPLAVEFSSIRKKGRNVVSAGDRERSILFEELYLLREEMRRWKIDLRTGIDFHAIVEQASCGVCVSTREGRIVSANAAFAARHGRTRDECIGAPFTQFLHESQRNESRRLLASAADGATPPPAHLLHSSKDAETFPMISLFYPLLDPCGLPAYVVAVCVDLPAAAGYPGARGEPGSTPELPGARGEPGPPRKQDRRAASLLREAEIQGQLGFWELDRETGQLVLSDHVYELVGMAPGIGLPTLPEERAPLHELDEALRSSLDAAVGPTARVPQELSLQVPGKGTRWFQYTITTVRDEDGRPRRHFGVLLDTTERKAADELARDQAARLKRQAQELEQKNLALHEMMGRLSEIQNAMNERTREILGSVVLPYLQQLRQSHNAGDRKVLERVEDAIRGLSLGTARPQKVPLSSLTRRELEVCRMIRRGLSSKEICQELAISLQSVQTHRNHIRRKLGLLNGGMNLTVFLQSMDLGSESPGT